MQQCFVDGQRTAFITSAFGIKGSPKSRFAAIFCDLAIFGEVFDQKPGRSCILFILMRFPGPPEMGIIGVIGAWRFLENLLIIGGSGGRL